MQLKIPINNTGINAKQLNITNSFLYIGICFLCFTLNNFIVFCMIIQKATYHTCPLSFYIVIQSI